MSQLPPPASGSMPIPPLVGPQGSVIDGEMVCDQREDEGGGCEGQTNTGHSSSHSTLVSVTQQRRLVGGAIGGQAHCNGWNGFNGTELNTLFPCVGCVWYHSIDSIPAITISPSSYSSSH